MKSIKLTQLLFILCSFAAFAQTVSSVQSGFYLPGNLGVRDLANPLASGLFISDYNMFISSNSFKDKDGNKINSLGPIPFEVDINGYINNLMVTYASEPIPALGNARYMAIAAPSFRTTGVDVALGQFGNQYKVDGGASGFGDFAVAPLYLSWGSEKFDLTTGYMFVAPTGRYKTGADDNVGLGYWSHILQTAAYYYPLPQKATAIMVMPTYEMHGKIKDSNISPGARFSLEYGISQYFSPRFDVSLQGGHVWQTGKDSGSEVYWDKAIKDKSSVFGAAAGYWLMPGQLYSNLKWSTTYAEHQNLSVNTFTAQIVFIPNLKKTATEASVQQ